MGVSVDEHNPTNFSHISKDAQENSTSFDTNLHGANPRGKTLCRKTRVWTVFGQTGLYKNIWSDEDTKIYGCNAEERAVIDGLLAEESSFRDNGLNPVFVSEIVPDDDI